MRQSNRPLLCLALAVLSSLTLLAQSSSRPVRTSQTSLDAALDAAVARHDVPGVVAMVVDRQGILYQKAAGTSDAPSARPLAMDAIFRIASMTKPITSIAAMQLVEQGRLSLDDQAGRYLPQLATMPVIASFDPGTGNYTLRRSSTPITIRHLMTHTAGFGYGFTSATTRDFKPRSGDSSVPTSPGIPSAPLLFDPGTQWWYGTNTDWLGQIVEHISGQTLDEYFRREILGPLGMADTFFNVPEPKQSRVVSVHRRRADDTLAATPPTFQAATSFSGGGGLASTASDYARFIRMVLNEGSLDTVRVVAPDTIRLMAANQIGDVTVRALKTANPNMAILLEFLTP